MACCCLWVSTMFMWLKCLILFYLWLEHSIRICSIVRVVCISGSAEGFVHPSSGVHVWPSLYLVIMVSSLMVFKVGVCNAVIMCLFCTVCQVCLVCSIPQIPPISLPLLWVDNQNMGLVILLSCIV